MSENKRGMLWFRLMLNNAKKYAIIGMLVPLLMAIPSMIVQGIWLYHDNNGTDPKLEYLYADTIPEYWEDKVEIENGRYKYASLKETWELQDWMREITNYGYTIVLASVIVFLLGDVFLSFWGNRASLDMAVPCSKQAILIAKLIPASICVLWTLFLIQVTAYLIEGGLKLDGGSITMVTSRSFSLPLAAYSHGFYSGIDWNFICSVMITFYIIYLGMVLTFSLCGKLARKANNTVIIVIMAAFMIFLAAVSLYNLMENGLWIAFIIPVLLLIGCILALRKHELIST